MRDRVFISYSHQDRAWLEKLKKYLAPLSNQLTVWDDEEIKPGVPWRAEIRSALDSARVAVLLVTQDFLNSKFIMNEELPIILEANKAEGLQVLWVAVKASLYKETPLAELQSTNDPSRPLHSLRGSTRDTALVKIAESIKAAFGKVDNGPHQLRTTWIVDQTGITDLAARTCKKIGDAVRNAANHDRIVVKEGVYEEEIVLDKPLELIGDGNWERIIIASVNSDVISFNTDEGKVARLTIRHPGSSSSAVRVTRGKLTLEDCDLSSKGLSCLSIQHGAEPSIRRNVIHDGRQEGIYVGEYGRGTIEQNLIHGNGFAGVAIKREGDPIVRNNDIYGGFREGIYIDENGQGVIEDNKIHHNKGTGITIKGGGRSILRRNRVYHNDAEGLYIAANAGPFIEEDNEIRDNGGQGDRVRLNE
jgi:parallel beta-helix repeat protein